MKKGIIVTEFQQRVYSAISRIPRGCVTTYKLLAEHLHCGSCRAVGQALRRNPFAPAVPCHRVIASDLKPGGFQGKRRGAAIAKKVRLLEGEGVRFENGKLADPRRLHRFGRKVSRQVENL